MAQQISVPQTQPNAPQFQVPTDLVNAYLNRETAAPQYIAQSINNAGDVLNRYHQQKIQNQLAALGAVSQLYGAGGPRAVNQFGSSINQATGTQVVPPPGTPQNVTIPFAQDPYPSQQIQASGEAGHPMHPEIAARHMVPTAGVQNQLGQVPQYNAPQPTADEMDQIRSGGIWGNKLGTSFKDMGDIAMQPITAAQKQLDMQKTGGELAMQPTEAELKKQQLINAQQQIPMEVKKTISGEVSKQGADTQQIRDLHILTQNLQGSMKGDLGYFGNVKGDIFQGSGGRYGSNEAANMQNATIPLATGLNTVLSHRFNEGEVKALSQSLIPQPKDTPQYRQQKLTNLNNLLDVMASGNEQNVKNVANAIMTGSIPSVTQGIQKLNKQSNIPVISNDEAFKALPSGSTFKDPSGQIHRKK